MLGELERRVQDAIDQANQDADDLLGEGNGPPNEEVMRFIKAEGWARGLAGALIEIARDIDELSSRFPEDPAID